MPAAPEAARPDRATLRAQGLRARRLWLPDLRGAAEAELRRQSARIAARTRAADDIAFAEHAQYWPGDPA